MERRDFIVLATALTQAGIDSSHADSKQSGNDKLLILTAPDDGFITRMSSLEGNVAEGQEVAGLDSPGLERAAGRIQLFIDLIEIAKRPFSDGRVEQMLADLEQTYKDAVGIENDDKAIADQSQGVYMHGMAEKIPADAAHATFLQASVSRISSERRFRQEPLRVADARDRLAKISQRLLQEQQLLEKLRDRLAIKSPRHGYFSSVVGIGSFVRKGYPIGVLKYA